MILFTSMIYLQWVWWEWEKKTRNIYKNKGKIPRLVPSHPPVYKIWGRPFFRGERNENKPDLHWYWSAPRSEISSTNNGEKSPLW